MRPLFNFHFKVANCEWGCALEDYAHMWRFCKGYGGKVKEFVYALHKGVTGLLLSCTWFRLKGICMHRGGRSRGGRLAAPPPRKVVVVEDDGEEEEEEEEAGNPEYSSVDVSEADVPESPNSGDDAEGGHDSHWMCSGCDRLGPVCEQARMGSMGPCAFYAHVCVCAHVRVWGGAGDNKLSSVLACIGMTMFGLCLVRQILFVGRVKY